MKTCPNCGCPNDDRASICIQCNWRLVPTGKQTAPAPDPYGGMGEPAAPVRPVRPTPWWKKIDWKKVVIALVALVLLAVAAVVVLQVLRKSRKASSYEKAKAAIAAGSNQEAFTWLEEAASYGNADAMYMLGEFYLSGIGTEADAEKGNALRQQAYEKGSSLACYGYGMEDLNAYVESGDAADLQACLSKLERSEEGDALYQRSLLMRVAGDIETADELLGEAINGGSVNATCEMAQYYLYSGDNDTAMELLQGYPYQEEPSIQATIAWVRMHNGESSSWQIMDQLAKGGNGLANAYLGEIYYEGLVPGQERDFNLAYSYYEKAAEAGCARGMLGLALTSMVREDGNDESVYALALRLYRQGYVNAGSTLGNLMITGRGTTVDRTGLQYIIAAANNCYAPAELYLGNYYFSEGDKERCLEYFQRAYNHDSRAAANLCATSYLGEEYVMGPDTLY